MQKFLKTDIADLLKSNLDCNAYGRAEGLYMELNLSSCYTYVQECCKLVSDQLKAIHKERVAVASLMHAASRFSDLLELRDIRTLFTDKYGAEALDIYFVEKLKSNAPTTEKKFELMKDIAKEFGIEWQPTSLQRKLNNNPALPQQQAILQDEGFKRSGYKLNRAMSDDVLPIPTPNYVKPTTDDNESSCSQGEGKQRPKSVRSRFIKKPENGGRGGDTQYSDVNVLDEGDYSTKPKGSTSMYRSRSDTLNLCLEHGLAGEFGPLGAQFSAGFVVVVAWSPLAAWPPLDHTLSSSYLIMWMAKKKKKPAASPSHPKNNPTNLANTIADKHKGMALPPSILVVGNERDISINEGTELDNGIELSNVHLHANFEKENTATTSAKHVKDSAPPIASTLNPMLANDSQQYDFRGLEFYI
ncbi:hypothetical protein V2J09_010874 [Rumex salicifolius]